MRKSSPVCERSCIKRRDIMIRFRWKSRSRHMKNETSSLLHPRNLQAPLYHSISSTDQTLQMRKPWVARVCLNPSFDSMSELTLFSVKNKRNEKAAKFSVPLPKVRGIAEEEAFKVVKTGKKTAKKGMSSFQRNFNIESVAIQRTGAYKPTSCIEWQLTNFRMETNDHKADIRRTRLYQTACQVWEIHSTYGTEI